jgi:carbon monoxide dehydrogenase subunit G
MRLEGAYTIPAKRDVVWRSLMDPQILSRALPGCEKMESNPDGSYRTELKVGIGAVRGSYHGRVQILDPLPLEHYRMKVEGKGAVGFVNGEGTLTLSDDAAGTVIRYTGDAQVGGVIASVGQRLLQGAAHKIVSQFFEALTKQLRSATQPGQGSTEVSSPPVSRS